MIINKIIILLIPLLLISCKKSENSNKDIDFLSDKIKLNEQYDMTIVNLKDISLLVKTTETTQREWTSVMGYNPSFFIKCGLSCPVEMVNFYEVLSFLNKISKVENLQECYNLNQCVDTYERYCPPGKYGCHGGKICQDISFNNDCNGYRLLTKNEWIYIYNLAFKNESKMYEYSVLGNSKKYMEEIGPVDDFGRDCSESLPVFSFEIKEVIPYCGLYEVKTRSKDKNNLYDFIGNVKEWVWLDDKSEEQMTNGCSWITIECLNNLEHTTSSDFKFFDTGFRFAKAYKL